MTYRKKAELLIMTHLGVSEYSAKEIVRLIETEGEYTPRVMSVLNAPENTENWDDEIPKSEE